jgi:hypothetical protein
MTTTTEAPMSLPSPQHPVWQRLATGSLIKLQTPAMINRLLPTEEVIQLVQQGRALALAAPQSELQRLPLGRWIGGTIPYFMLAEGGAVSRAGHVFVTDLSSLGDVSIAFHPADDLAGIVREAPANGFSYTIIPAGCPAHRRFAADTAGYADAFLKPTVGWIAGVHLDELGRVDPKRRCRGRICRTAGGKDGVAGDRQPVRAR